MQLLIVKVICEYK